MARATLDPTPAGAAGGWVHVRLSRRKGWHNIADAEWLAARGAARLVLKALVALVSSCKGRRKGKPSKTSQNSTLCVKTLQNRSGPTLNTLAKHPKATAEQKTRSFLQKCRARRASSCCRAQPRLRMAAWAERRVPQVRQRCRGFSAWHAQKSLGLGCRAWTRPFSKGTQYTLPLPVNHNGLSTSSL